MEPNLLSTVEDENQLEEDIELVMKINDMFLCHSHHVKSHHLIHSGTVVFIIALDVTVR